LQFENVKFPDKVGFKCKNCGLCCKDQPADTNPEEQKRIETKGFSDFLEDEDGTELRWIKRKKDGSCFFLTEENKCSIYEVRPVVCRMVPFVVTDWDYENNLIEVDISADYFCRGVFDGDALPSEVIGKAVQEYVKEMLRRVAKEEGLPTTDKKVLSVTRKLLMGML